MTLSINRLFAAEVESTYGTDVINGTPSTFLAARAVDVVNQFRTIEAPRATATTSGEAHKIVDDYNRFTASIPLTGKESAAGDAPHYDAILQACGLQKTVNAATSVVYNPATINAMSVMPSATVYCYYLHQNEAKHRLIECAGMRGTLEFVFPVGDEAYINVDGAGLFFALPETGTSYTSGSFEPSAYSGDKSALCVQGITLSFNDGGGAQTFEVSELRFALNYSVTLRRAATASTGLVSEVLLTRPKGGQRMGGSMTLTGGINALEHVLTNYRSNTQFTGTVSLSDGTDTAAFAMAAAQFLPPQLQDRDELLQAQLGYALCRSSDGNDDFTLTYT